MIDSFLTNQASPAWLDLIKKLGLEAAFGLSIAARDPSLETDIYPDAVSTGVLPDPTREHRLRWNEIRALVPRSKITHPRVSTPVVDRLLELRNKRDFSELSEQAFPFRTKTDRSLRRSRLLDWFVHARRVNEIPALRTMLLSLPTGMDMIWLQNVIAAFFVFGQTWFERWVWLGAFDSDLSHFISVAKCVHDLGKTRGIDDPDWLTFVECAGLSGYRSQPFPGFNLLDEAKKLAAGGEEHNLYGRNWAAMCKKYLPMPFVPVDYIPFKTWVEKADWLTAGASSVGRLEIEFPDGKTKKIKARKNMVADVVSLSQLADDALAATKQVNVAIVKSELGKLRVAVAGDLYTYLKMTWINELLGGAYYNWPGNTSEEDFSQQTRRMSDMLDKCAQGYGLPYDYAGFDHQPQTTELLGIVDHLNSHARLNVPHHALTEFDSIARNVRDSFLRSELVVHPPGEDSTSLPVTGGLMSGLRWTSIVGNAWNSIMTGLALELMHDWGIDPSTVTRYIRGDDSAIFAPNWATVAAMDLAYKQIGAIAGEGKFSIQYGATEFLRVWYDSRCQGYPCRSVPGLTQRKPWSSNPWSEDMVLRALYETICTLRRRLPSRRVAIDSVWVSFRQIWCRNHSLPVRVTSVPVFAGGFGLEPPPVGQLLRCQPHVPKADLTGGFRAVNQNTWRADNIAAHALERYSMEVDATEIAHTELLTTVTSDNVPEFATAVRKDWLSKVRAARVRVVAQSTDIVAPQYSIDPMSFTRHNVDTLSEQLRLRSPMFGSAPELATARADYDRFKPDCSFRQWIDRFFPTAAAKVRRFHHSWHISEILNYLEGTIFVTPQVLHPVLSNILMLSVAQTLDPRKRSVRGMSQWIGSMFEPLLVQSPLAHQVYSW